MQRQQQLPNLDSSTETPNMPVKVQASPSVMGHGRNIRPPHTSGHLVVWKLWHLFEIIFILQTLQLNTVVSCRAVPDAVCLYPVLLSISHTGTMRYDCGMQS
jgi:hypothetical protein